jgi:hypothetical protein
MPRSRDLLCDRYQVRKCAVQIRGGCEAARCVDKLVERS